MVEERIKTWDKNKVNFESIDVIKENSISLPNWGLATGAALIRPKIAAINNKVSYWSIWREN